MYSLDPDTQINNRHTTLPATVPQHYQQLPTPHQQQTIKATATATTDTVNPTVNCCLHFNVLNLL